MTDPTKSIANQTATRLAVKNPELEEIPLSKRATMVLRTGIGILFVVIGLLLLVFLTVLPIIAAYKANDMKSVSLTLVFVGLGAGIALAILGASVWSSTLMKNPIRVVLETLKSVLDVIFRRGTPPTPPTEGGS